MTLGNTVALVQTNLKRLLRLLVDRPRRLPDDRRRGRLRPRSATRRPSGVYTGGEGILFYLAAYALMTLGAFAVLLVLSGLGEPSETIDDLAGLSRTRPLLALAMALCLFSLAGVPPLAGFWGKFFIFASAWTAEPIESLPSLRLLAVIGVINAAVGCLLLPADRRGHVLRDPAQAPAADRRRPAWPTAAAVGICAVLSVLVGLIPAPLQRASRDSALSALRQPVPVAAPEPADEDELALATPANGR